LNWVDFFVLGIVVIAVFSGYRRGLFKEVSTFIGLIFAIIFSINYADWLAMKIEGTFNLYPSLLYVFCFAAIFIFTLFVLKLLGHYFYMMVKITPLKYPNKVGGGIFGILKGMLFLSLVLLMFIFVPVFHSLNQSIDESMTAPTIRMMVPTAFDMTMRFHPDSGKFADKVTRGVLGSKALKYAGKPEALLKNNELLGMSLKDIRVLDNIDKYFGQPTELARRRDKN
jgi:membrane protein required for colicin V production